MAPVALVFLIVCVNIAHLQLGRDTQRGREMAVRLAIGASRFRLTRQLLTESLLLALLGGVLGIAFAAWGVNAISAYLPAGSLELIGRLELDRGAPVRVNNGKRSAGSAVTREPVPAVTPSPRPRFSSALEVSRRYAECEMRSY